MNLDDFFPRPSCDYVVAVFIQLNEWFMGYRLVSFSKLIFNVGGKNYGQISFNIIRAIDTELSDGISVEKAKSNDDGGMIDIN